MKDTNDGKTNELDTNPTSNAHKPQTIHRGTEQNRHVQKLKEISNSFRYDINEKANKKMKNICQFTR